MTANGRLKGRSGADSVLLTALAGGSTAADAATAAKVSERTVRRRLAEPDFVTHLEELRREVIQSALVKVSSSAVQAVTTLVSLLDSEQPSSTRLGAAKAVLDYGIRLRAESEFAERLTAIETHLAISERKMI